MESSVKKNKRLRQLIVALSIVIPLAVAALFGIRVDGIDLHFLPGIYAGINGLTAILLVVALLLAKQKKFKLHENVIKVCMLLSVLFLLCYVAYHMTSDSTVYGDIDGNGELSAAEKMAVSAGMRLTYFILLISHIVLSVIVIPMVLYSYLHALETNFDRHRKLVKYTWPVWFYVAVSGVLVYLMISPFYTHS
jgi:putative membrane protein